MANGTIQVGDCVKVVGSNGPWMTVEQIDGDHVRCTWFDGQDEPHRQTFSYAMLAFGWRCRPGGPMAGGLTGGTAA